MRTLLLLVVALVIGSVAAYLATGVASVPPAEAVAVHPIVGRWQHSVLGGRPVAPGMGMIFEYRADGVMTSELHKRDGTIKREEGTYYVIGNRMHILIPSRVPPKSDYYYDFVIVDSDRCITTNVEPGNEEECVRLVR